MIDYLRGVAHTLVNNTGLIDVNGVGYAFICNGRFDVEQTKNSYYGYTKGKQKGLSTVLIHSIGNDKGEITLYGFSTWQQRVMFRDLISCNGVGPKLALSLLDQTLGDTLKTAIKEGNAKGLMTYRGVGEAVSRKIIDKLQKTYQ